MIKRRTRPQLHVRETSQEEDDTAQDAQKGSADEEDDKSLPLSELLELHKLRKSRQGIDIQKLSKGVVKWRKRRATEEDEHQDAGGLKPGAKVEEADNGGDAKARRAVRTSNFTQQTNAVDVNKHMTEKKAEVEEGSVTSSLTMLTCIPEVDLGMDARLKNIEETEKAKRQVTEERKERKKVVENDEEHLVATRFYRPYIKQKSDAEIMRNAKLEAMGISPPEQRQHRNDRPQIATDDMVCTRENPFVWCR
ncbi:hypothetical protein SCLCIDRAFT_1218341, partial [Scleroderma citrinum Foug A]